MEWWYFLFGFILGILFILYLIGRRMK